MRAKDDISYDLAASRLDYDGETGIFTWKVTLRGGSAIAGRRAGKLHIRNGYRLIKINQRCYSEHRLAWLLTNGAWPDADLDHIDGDRANNRISNLRKVTSSQNNWNVPAGQGFSRLRSGNFRAEIRANRKRIRLGTFNSEDGARAAYLAAKEKYHGEFWARRGEQ